MTRLSLVSLSAALLGAAPLASAEPITVDITARRSSITFTSDAPGERIVGTATEITGTVSTDLATPAATTGTLHFPVSSMRTGNAVRDRHLQSDDWLNAEAHPSIVFEITALEDVSSTQDGGRTDITGVAVGTVTVNGVAAPVRAQVAVAVNAETRTVRIQPTFSVSLAAHDVAGRDGAIGDTVGTTIDIEGTIYGAWE